MKTRFILVLAAVAAGGCAWMSNLGGQGPTYGDNCIDFPGTSVPPRQLNQIVARLQRDKKFPRNYRVVVWDKGNPGHPIGRMKIGKTEATKSDTYAKNSGLTALTYRVGNCAPSGAICNPKCPPPTLDSKRLAEEVKDILKSY